MKLLGLHSIDALGVPDGTYEFARGPSDAYDLVVITGPEGSGKTRLLELILAAREVLSPTGADFAEESWVRSGNRTAKALLAWLLSDDERAEIGAPHRVVHSESTFCADPRLAGPDKADPGLLYLLERYGHDDGISKLEYFPENRRLDVGGGEMSLDAEPQKTFRSGKSPRKFSFLPSFLATLPHTNPSALRFAASLDQLSDTCRYDLQRHGLTSRGAAVRSLSELAASEADAVIFAATAALVRLSRSIVLVDRPELHGDRGDHFLAGLRSLGFDNQLFVATTSPELATNGPDRRVIRLDPDDTFP